MEKITYLNPDYNNPEKKQIPTEQEEIIKKHQENLCKIAQEIFRPENELGFGQTAIVCFVPGIQNVCCKKLKLEDAKTPINTLYEEADFLYKLTQSHPEVIIPIPISVIEINKKVEKNNLKGEKVLISVKEQALVMEEIKGYSIRDFFERKIPNAKKFFEDFDIDLFFNKLENFLNFIHSEPYSIHHRDLHAGNIMIEENTHTPAVIDFGSAGVKYGEEDIYRHTTMKRTATGNWAESTEIIKPDFVHLKEIKTKMKEELNLLT